jgi:hypothetical protein
VRRFLLASVLAILAIFSMSAVAPTAIHAQTAAPAVTTTPSSVAFGGTTTIHGTGFTPNYYAYVYFQRPDGTANAVNVVTDATGVFNLALGFSSTHGTGSEFVTAYNYTTGRWAPFVTVTVTTGAPVPAAHHLTASLNPVAIGQTTTITATGFTPNNYVYFYFKRPDGTAGALNILTSSTGSFTQSLGFIANHLCGPELVAVYDYTTKSWYAPITLTVTGC